MHNSSSYSSPYTCPFVATPGVGCKVYMGNPQELLANKKVEEIILGLLIQVKYEYTLEHVFRARVVAYSMEQERIESEDWTIGPPFNNAIVFEKTITPLSKKVKYWLILPSLPSLKDDVYGIQCRQTLRFKQEEVKPREIPWSVKKN